MKAKITVDKSFDDLCVFKKDIIPGDLKEFFNEEGKYLERLASATRQHGESGDEWSITYTVTVTA